MAEIKKGEHFVVRRGFEYNSSSFLLPSGEIATPQNDENPKHDRSQEGRLFLAVEVCSPMVAAECVHGSHRDIMCANMGGSSRLVPHRITFNMDEVELWPVTKAFVDAMLQPERKPA